MISRHYIDTILFKIIGATGEAFENLKPDSWNVIGGSADSGFNMVAHALKMLECCKSDGFMPSEICDTCSQRILESAYNVDQKDIQIRTQKNAKKGKDSEVIEYVNKTCISHFYGLVRKCFYFLNAF